MRAQKEKENSFRPFRREGGVGGGREGGGGGEERVMDFNILSTAQVDHLRSKGEKDF